MRKLHDAYFKQAKREGRLARSVYKLAELDSRYKLMAPGHRVLDLGAAPGSWLEYILEAIGAKGVAVAVDLKPIHKKFKGRATFRLRDVRQLTPEDFQGVVDSFDAVLSDMAPNTSGIKVVDQARSLELCHAALDVAERWLAPGGSFVCKIFDGPDADDLRARLKASFADVRAHKPDACRAESMETYCVARRFRPPTPSSAAPPA